MTLAYAVALTEARSCLAALADGAADFDESSHFEHLLLDLDRLHPIGPGLSPMAGTKAELLAWLEAAVEDMIGLGGDRLSLELLLTDDMGDSDRAGSVRISVFLVLIDLVLLCGGPAAFEDGREHVQCWLPSHGPSCLAAPGGV